MRQDPFGVWTGPRCWRWALLGVVVASLWGPSFVSSLRPSGTAIVDFFQEWTSARNVYAQLPVYTSLEVAAQRHLGMTRDPSLPWPVNVNAHPPTAVVLALPFGWLDYPNAVLAWNLVSLSAMALSIWLIVRQLGIVFSPWSLLPFVTLLLMCDPFRQQVNQGQLNLILLLLIVGVWALARSGRPAWAGCLLGAATAIKLFPGFLLLHFLVRRRWSTVIAAVGSLGLLTGFTVAVLGAETYRVYFSEVVPAVSQFRDWWPNLSIVGFWSRLFDAPSGHVVPLYQWPLLAVIGTAGCCGVVVALVAYVGRRARSLQQDDMAFALAVAGMLLISPITWGHYFLSLMLPAALIWIWLPNRLWVKVALVAVIVAIWINPKLIWDATIPGPGELLGGVAAPLHTVTVLSYQFVTAAAFFAIVYWRSQQPFTQFAAAATPSPAATREEWPFGSPTTATTAPADEAAASGSFVLGAAPAGLATFVVIQAVILGSGASWAAFCVQRHAAERGLPAARNTPIEVAPLDDYPDVVSDDQLRAVLTKLKPRFRAKQPKINYVDHSLRCWGVKATFADAECQSSEEMRQLLLDHRQFAQAWGDETEPLLVDAAWGVDVRVQEGQASSSHVDHMLATQAEIGTPLDFPVVTPSRQITLRALLEQALRDFSLNQVEYEWSVLTCALYVAPTKRWLSAEGQEITFDRMADRLMRQDLTQGVCYGNHRLHTLVVLLRVDDQERILSDSMRQRIVDHLQNVTRVLVASQHADGFWIRTWTSPARTDGGHELREQILATGHPLEWWALAPKELRPPRETLVKAAQWLCRTIEKLDATQVEAEYAPLTHAGRALALWRGRTPADVDLDGPTSDSAAVAIPDSSP